MPRIHNTRQIQSPPVSIGVLLANTGTPEAPSKGSIRSFLAEFLSDPRIIRWPRWFWWPLLHLVILRVRPARVASKYREIWNGGRSPLLAGCEALAADLQGELQARCSAEIAVVVGMRYGAPSIREALRALRAEGVTKLIVLPLFPQFSTTTVSSVYDVVFDELSAWSWMPETHLIAGYHDHPAYLQALAASIRDHWQAGAKPDRLLFSYHGIPKSYSESGDPYVQQCAESTERVAAALGHDQVVYQTAYQSRFGPEEWSQPYTMDVLAEWAAAGTDHVQVVCPGFPVDCLETLHEIEIEARLEFSARGGRAFEYIPALNASRRHVVALANLLEPCLACAGGGAETHPHERIEE